MSNYVQLKTNRNLSYKVYGIINKDGEDCFLLWFDNHWGYVKVETCVSVDSVMFEPLKTRKLSDYSK
jgi:hypothetical protein